MSGDNNIEVIGPHHGLSEDKKDKGEVEAPSATKDARNFDPHMFREMEAIAIRRSFS